MREKEQALLLHLQRFGKAGRAFGAPARVNLIGEHTDYTGGLVMPMAIGFHTVAVLSPRADNRAVFYSASFDEEVSFEIASMGLIPDGRWSDYPAGVLWSLRQEGFKIDGFNMSLVGDVPLGAGLSSSASLEVASAMALLGHAKEVLPLKRLATLCRRPRTSMSAPRVESWISLSLGERSRTGRCFSIAGHWSSSCCHCPSTYVW
jgi:galactokinase